MVLLFGPVPQIGPLQVAILLAVMVGLPLLLFAPFAKVAYDRWRGDRPPVHTGSAPVSDKWWVLVVVQPIWFLLLLVIGLFSTAAQTAIFSDIAYPMVLVGIVLLLLCPIGVHFDRKYVAAVADWRPSIAYYLTFASLVGVLLAAMYLYERHEHVGVP